METTEKVFQFATRAREKFLQGDLQTKKEILMSLGQNCTIKGEKLSLEVHEWLQPISEGYSQLEKEYLKLEPQKNRFKTAKKECFDAIRLRWSDIVDSIRTIIQNQPKYIHIPVFEHI